MRKRNSPTEYVSGPAEYRWSQDRTWARVIFLRAIERYTPRVLEELRNQVLPVYRPLHPKSAPMLQKFKSDYALQEQVRNQIQTDVARWADLFHLRGPGGATSGDRSGGLSLFDWIAEIAVCTLVEWQADPGRGLKWADLISADLISADLQPHSVHASLECPEPFLFETDGWARQRETEAVFKKRIRRTLAKQLQEYIIDERGSKGEDLLPVPSRIANNHFAYLALSQCLRHPHSQIALQFKCKRSSVSEGIRTAAEAVIGKSYGDWLMPALPAGRHRADGNA